VVDRARFVNPPAHGAGLLDLAADELVNCGSASAPVDAGSAVQRVPSFLAGEAVRAAPAIEVVVAETAEDPVGAGASHDQIIPEPTFQALVAYIAPNKEFRGRPSR
jgi:hypothetical protein